MKTVYVIYDTKHEEFWGDGGWTKEHFYYFKLEEQAKRRHRHLGLFKERPNSVVKPLAVVDDGV